METVVMVRKPWLWYGNRGYDTETMVMIWKSWLWYGNRGYDMETVVMIRKQWLWYENRGYDMETVVMMFVCARRTVHRRTSFDLVLAVRADWESVPRLERLVPGHMVNRGVDSTMWTSQQSPGWIVFPSTRCATSPVPPFGYWYMKTVVMMWKP